jgi:alpha-ketoglutarate-dependent taurine dioxygenase
VLERSATLTSLYVSLCLWVGACDWMTLCMSVCDWVGMGVWASGMQMLQCIRAADTGGANVLVDARQAALYLRERDPDAFRILTTIPVRFHRQQKAFVSVHESPMLRLDEQGRFAQVRHSYFTLAPFDRPFAAMRAFYRAYQALSAVLHDPRNQLCVPLAPGDLVLYDNHRMLHARTGFKGPRHMRGVYFHRADVDRRLNEGAGTPPPPPAAAATASLWLD